jgi:cytoskeletal protein CcmA (bactofilin family)
MWGRRPNNESEQDSTAQTQSQTQPRPDTAPRAGDNRATRTATQPTTSGGRPAEGSSSRLGKRLKFVGEITGSEDLQIDGDFGGKIELKDNCLTIGPNAEVEADVHARSIYIAGRLKGNVEAPERIELRKTGALEGDVVTAGIVIEEGAVFRGSIDIVKPDAVKTAAVPSAKQPESARSHPNADVPAKADSSAATA